MNKKLKFLHMYVEYIVKLDTFTTFRLFDDKNLSVGDVVGLLDSETGEKFATAKITKIKEASFEEMIKRAADKGGMYEQYKKYYSRDIKPDDRGKYIDFEMVRE